jgi:hypothetical protein
VIKGLVPAAFVAVMIFYFFPFGVLAGVHRFSDSGLLAFFGGFVLFVRAPLDPFFETFSLPLIAAFAGLFYQRRPGWIGSLAPLICAVVGLTCLGSAYFWEKSQPLAYGYFAAEVGFVIAAVASAVRLILLRRNRAMWDARTEARFEPAASASQELLSRYRKSG